MKITMIKRGACKTNDLVMVYVNDEFIGQCEKSAVKALLKVCGYIH